MISVKINGTEYNRYVPLPIKWNQLLDERLDEGVISVHSTDIKLFRIGTKVNISVTDNTDIKQIDLDFIVAADTATEVPVGSGKYDHDLTLIEPTKILEGVVVETLTFTNSLGRNYPTKLENVAVTTKYYDQNGEIATLPIAVGIRPNATLVAAITNQREPFSTNESFTFPAWDALFNNRNYYIQFGSVYIIAPDGSYIRKIFKYFDVPRPSARSVSIDAAPIIESLKAGHYTAQYEIGIKERNTDESSWTSNEFYQTTLSFEFSVVANISDLPKWNIKSVINRVLDLAEPHLTTADPHYYLDPEQRAEFEKIEAPEFAFTNKTLKEILDQIGGFIHGVPRLIGSKIHFDMLGGTEQAALSDPKYPYVTEIRSNNIESYATDLDSTPENFVNTLDTGEGSIVEPYAGGYKSVRSEQAYARITEDNMVIETMLPIYSVQKLEVLVPAGAGGNSNPVAGDITPFVFEGAEYGRLSSFQGEYPISKAYAIYYELGQRNIKGLNFKSPTVIGGAGAKYSIANIVKSVTGLNISADWWGGDYGNYPRLAFRITYTPVFSARVLQHKPIYDSSAMSRTLTYNQGANLIETRYYGENLKGTIARIGNDEFVRTYVIRYNKMSLIPKIGQIWDNDYYVSSVTNALYADHCVCTVGMSKDFNRLSQYVGINSEWRAYEVSEKNAYNREYIYRDFMLIDNGKPIPFNNTLCVANESLVYESLLNTFTQSADAKPPVSAAVVKSYQEGVDEPISTVTAPVVSTAFGNSLQFAFGMQDNFSAGYQSQEHQEGNITGYWQTDAQYPDYYGRIDTVDFKLTGGNGASANGTTEFLLPNGDCGGEYVYFSPSTAHKNVRLVIKKNNTEVMRYNYQLDFAVRKTESANNMNDVIIGPALTHNSPLVRPTRPDHSAALYVISKRVGKFQAAISLDNSEQIKSYADGTGIEIDNGSLFSGKHLKLLPQVSTINGKAWVIADSATGEILLARNIDITIGDNIELPNMYVWH